MKSMKSSVENVGKIVDQIIIFKGGIKKTIRNIKSETIEQGEMTKFYTVDGKMVLVNTRNVLMVEVFNH